LCTRLLADLIGDGRADIVCFGDAEGALIEVASRCHVFQADGPNWRPASVGAVRLQPGFYSRFQSARN
jgi:hypothetical protein